MPSVRVSTKGQIVLPAGMRHRLGMEPGTVVEVVDAGSHLVIVARAEDPIREFRGMFAGADSLTEALLFERRVERSRE